MPRCFNFPSQLLNPPVFSWREWDRPNWQKSMDTNGPEHVKPRACRSAWVSRTFMLKFGPGERVVRVC